MRQTTDPRVDAFIAGLDSPVKEVAEALRRLVGEAAPEARETVKWGFPTWEQNGLMCSIAPARGYARLQFFRGADLRDPDGLLEGTGIGMRHVKLRSADSLPLDALQALVKEAVRRNVAAG